MKRTTFLMAGLLVLPGLAHSETPMPSPYDQAPWWMRDQVVAQTGLAFVELPANRAGFTATFRSVDKTVGGAQGRAMDQVRGLQRLLAQKGRDKVRVSTDFTMNPMYKQYRDADGNMVDDQRGDRITGYEVDLTVNVTVLDVSELESVYSLALAAAPASIGDINFFLQTDNATESALQTAALSDARTRAKAAADAAGGVLGAVRLIDPAGQACASDLLGPGPVTHDSDGVVDSITAEDLGSFPDASMAESLQRVSGVSVSRFSAENVEAQAARNSFVQTPPILRISALACVVYDLN